MGARLIGYPTPMTVSDHHTGQRPHRVVVVGGGFAGLQAVRGLRRLPVEITLLDRRNFHLFQPLVYQVATGVLSPGEIASPLRALFRNDNNVRVVLGEVTDIDLGHRRVVLDPPADDEQRQDFSYDTLVVATGSDYSYFGHDEWRPIAPAVKSLESALDVRRRILTAFEAAEVEPDPDRREAWLTFVVVGAGPTGVELAGQIAEMARHTLQGEFRTIDPREARILLVEMADRVLPMFPGGLSARAAESLEELGVTPALGRRVVDMDEGCVAVTTANGDTSRIPSRTVVWAAGVLASGLATTLARESGAQLDRGGRVSVGPDLTLAGHPEVIALGDMVRVHDVNGNAITLPGLAPVAMQEGRYAAKAMELRLRGQKPPPFRYRDKGNLATIGRAKAVAEIGRIRLSGLPAWIMWLLVHIFYLIGLENRVLVLIRWAFSFFLGGHGTRLIAREPVTPPPPPGDGAAGTERAREADRVGRR